MNRKEFIRRAGAISALTALGLQFESCSDEDDGPTMGGDIGLSLDLTTEPFDQILARNWLLHPEENILIVNWEDEIRAFTSVCTHSGCSRNWIFGRGTLTCQCHSSTFNHLGEVTSGPASGDLAEFSVVREGDILTIS
ncbi:MAG: Rieske (2Fe-2S) protein [Bacteroidota bacterium]